MTKRNRVHIDDYKGNMQYGGFVSAYMTMYCFGCKRHRPKSGGKPVGRLRLFKCADCLKPKDENQTEKGTDK